jgi:hypothetical protein
VQFALEASVLSLERIERGRHLAGGQLLELLLPDFEALLVDAQLGGDLSGALAADRPVPTRKWSLNASFKVAGESAD